MRLQVLVATMHQKDCFIYQKMNIRCDAVIANQADCDRVDYFDTSFGKVKMVTTPTRGVGLNRNHALLAADADILLLADDDIVYHDDMPESVISAFDELPEADVICFGMNITKAGRIVEKRTSSVKRLHFWNSMRYGTYRIAIRKKALIDKNIFFHQAFGGGCPFSAGEDSLFLKTCFDRGLKVYSHNYVLGTCSKDTSTWFVGYNEKFFYDKGILVYHLFPKSSYLFALYFAIFFKRKTDLNVYQRLKLVYRGVRAGKFMTPYQERV